MSTLRKYLFASIGGGLIALVLALPIPAANAGNVNQSPNSVGEAIGQVVWALKQCGYYDLAGKTRTQGVKDFGEAVNVGERAMGKFDGYSGGCGSIQDMAEQYLDSREGS